MKPLSASLRKFRFRRQSNGAGDKPPPSLFEIPNLIQAMQDQSDKNRQKAIEATELIYDLCDVKHKENRIPMVCSGQWDVLTPLSQCLIHQTGDGRHLACLALNNLSIPIENKRVIASGPASKAVLGALCTVIAEDKEDAYLCFICLMNLSFLDGNIPFLLKFSPMTRPGDKPRSPVDNPRSLLRVLEKYLLRHSAHGPKGDGLRWACGFIKNLTKTQDNAVLVANTDIPKCLVEYIRIGTNNLQPNRWANNSLEDFSLFILLNLSQFSTSKESVLKCNPNVIDVLKPIISKSNGAGLQNLKATMAIAMLGANWDDFPNGGTQALETISKLMSTMVDKHGKNGQYASTGIFDRTTVAKAYQDLQNLQTQHQLHENAVHCIDDMMHFF